LQYTLKTRSNIVKNKTGKTLFNNDDVANRWRYLENLYIAKNINNQEYIKNEQDWDSAKKEPEITDTSY